jgi:hypothetical protein
MAPEGYHYVRGHMRRNPRPRMKRTSGWVIAAIVVAVLWLWGHGTGGASAGTAPGRPAPTSSTAAGR